CARTPYYYGSSSLDFW
nr:immunoglobulin heavy chain junction region [Mus musculus]